MLTTTVYCSLQIPGIHRWKNCPFDEVGYLTSLHRHMFHIKAYKRVQHDDRDVEFIMLKNAIEQYLRARYFDDTTQSCLFDCMSCEMIAVKLIDEFDLCKCEVNEDGENGAIVEQQ